MVKNDTNIGMEKINVRIGKREIIWVKSIFLFNNTLKKLSLFVQKKKKGKVSTCAMHWVPAKQGACARHAAGAELPGTLHPEYDQVNEGHWINGHLQGAMSLSSYAKF